MERTAISTICVSNRDFAQMSKGLFSTCSAPPASTRPSAIRNLHITGITPTFCPGSDDVSRRWNDIGFTLLYFTRKSLLGGSSAASPPPPSELTNEVTFGRRGRTSRGAFDLSSGVSFSCVFFFDCYDDRRRLIVRYSFVLSLCLCTRTSEAAGWSCFASAEALLGWGLSLLSLPGCQIAVPRCVVVIILARFLTMCARVGLFCSGQPTRVYGTQYGR